MVDPSPTQFEPPRSATSSRNLKLAGIGAAVVALAVVGYGISSRSNADHQLVGVASDAAVPAVSVVTPTRGDRSTGLVLPGSVQAYNSAPIYARTNGYVRRWLVDIGDRVVAGQTLAILDAPEVDQQLAQAEANYQTALANASLAKSTSVRWVALRAKDAVSQQETDEKAGDLASKNAIANGELANLKRLRALQGFTRLAAPFAGTVTSRSAQIGGLVSSGTASATALFTVSDVHRMRVYVRVPQGASAQVHAGMHATMTLPEYPGRNFDLVLTRNAGAVDLQSGTVLVELQTDNPGGVLKPGSYSQVTFPLAAAGNSVHLPASALILRANGPTVAMVDGNSRVTMKPVTIGRDEGKQVEISAGLNGNERIIDSPPDALESGDRVRIEDQRKAGRVQS